MSIQLIGTDTADIILTAALWSKHLVEPLHWWAAADKPHITNRLAGGAAATEVGQMLLEHNYRAYHHDDVSGAPEREPWKDYTFRAVKGCSYGRTESAKRPLLVASAFEQIAYYVYQTAQYPGWDGSEADMFCEALRHRLMRHFLYDGPGRLPWVGDRDYYDQFFNGELTAVELHKLGS
jgi:hypothetical protein